MPDGDNILARARCFVEEARPANVRHGGSENAGRKKHMLARVHTPTLRLQRSLPRRSAMRGLFSRAPTSAALKVGDNLLDFPDYLRPLPATPGDMVALSSFKGKKAVVVFFYPKDDTVSSSLLSQKLPLTAELSFLEHLHSLGARRRRARSGTRMRPSSTLALR
jgi:hypothetical protein